MGMATLDYTIRDGVHTYRYPPREARLARCEGDPRCEGDRWRFRLTGGDLPNGEQIGVGTFAEAVREAMAHCVAHRTLTLSTGETLNALAVAGIALQSGLSIEQIGWGIELGYAYDMIGPDYIKWALPFLNGERIYDEDGDFDRAVQRWPEDPLLSLCDAFLHIGVGDIETEAEYEDAVRLHRELETGR